MILSMYPICMATLFLLIALMQSLVCTDLMRTRLSAIHPN